MVNSENFQSEVLESPMPVIVFFHASWCGACSSLKPTVDELVFDLVGKAKVVKLSVDDSKDIARKYRVMSIPTLLLIKNGVEEKRIVGVHPKSEIISEFGF